MIKSLIIFAFLISLCFSQADTLIDLSITNSSQITQIFSPLNITSGYSVNSAGDFNGDGIDDIIIGGFETNIVGAALFGSAYVLFGSKDGIPNLNLNNPLNSSQGFWISSSYSTIGRSVNSAGDINGDGLSDIILGDYQFSLLNRTLCGVAYVIYGTKSELSNINLDNGLDSSLGFTVIGSHVGDLLGSSVSSAGDLNGDGFDDIAIGASLYGPLLGRYESGAVFVLYGSQERLSDIDLANGLNATQGFKIIGNLSVASFGNAVNKAGDVNGDGIDDIIVGNSDASPLGRLLTGTAHVIYGSKTGFSDIDLAVNFTSSQGFSIIGNNTMGHFGYSVNSAGDVNGDGIGDIIIGSSPIGMSLGSAYIIYGSKDGLDNIDLANNLTETQGFSVISGQTTSSLGYSVSGAGDVNQDGIDDVIIGAYDYTLFGKGILGSAYIIYGSKNGISNIDLKNNLTAEQGLMIMGATSQACFGYSVSNAGDVNGDGLNDIIVGAEPHWRDGNASVYIFLSPMSKIIEEEMELVKQMNEDNAQNVKEVPVVTSSTRNSTLGNKTTKASGKSSNVTHSKVGNKHGQDAKKKNSVVLEKKPLISELFI